MTLKFLKILPFSEKKMKISHNCLIINVKINKKNCLFSEKMFITLQKILLTI